MIQTYEKIPTKIRARQLQNTVECLADLRELMGEDFPQIWHTGDDDEQSEIYLFIPTYEGKTKAKEGDYITKSPTGEYFVYNAELFKKIYILLWD